MVKATLRIPPTGTPYQVIIIPDLFTARVRRYRQRADTDLIVTEHWSQAAITGPGGTLTLRTERHLGELLDSLDELMISGWPGYGARYPPGVAGS